MPIDGHRLRWPTKKERSTRVSPRVYQTVWLTASALEASAEAAAHGSRWRRPRPVRPNFPTRCGWRSSYDKGSTGTTAAYRRRPGCPGTFTADRPIARFC